MFNPCCSNAEDHNIPKLITHSWKTIRSSPDEPTIPDPVVIIKDDGHILIIVDADGSPDAKEIDATGQIETSPYPATRK